MVHHVRERHVVILGSLLIDCAVISLLLSKKMNRDNNPHDSHLTRCPETLFSYYWEIIDGGCIGYSLSCVMIYLPAAQLDRPWTLGGLIQYVWAYHLHLKQ
jgi:hypothetical protein